MSKILRRPMFRGGAVDSRGTGITSGLFNAPSYNTGGRVGFFNGGDLILGKDINTSLQPLNITPVNKNLPKFKGQKFYEEKEEAEAYVPKYQSMDDFDRAYDEKVEKERESVDSLLGTEFGTGTYEDERQKDLSYLTSDQGKSDFIAKEQAKQDKEIIEANKLRFAGAPGSTTQEKFQTYLQAESQAGKGRLEKINETAAALAINDYVAGKRSKEQIENLKEVAKYKGSIAKGSIGAQILEQAKGGTVTSGMIEQVIKGNYPGSNVQKFPKGSIAEGTIAIGKDDEGTFIIEEETKKAFFIRGGKPVPVY